MSTTITFNQLRRLKDSLPNGSMKAIAKELDLNVETVRNYFGGANYKKGMSVGMHMEPGPDGGIIKFDDATILNFAKEILEGKRKVFILS